MNHITKPASITLMGIIGVVATLLYSPPASAKLVIKTVTEAKSKVGQSCFSENNTFVAVYCNCRKSESDDGTGNCRDDSYAMASSGWCKLPGGGEGIGSAYCVGSLPVANTCSFCGCTDPLDESELRTEDGYSPMVYYYYEYTTPQTPNGYSCSGTRTKKYTCNRGYYVYSWDTSRSAPEECAECPTLTGADGKTKYADTIFPNLNSITSCFFPAGSYKDKTGTFNLLDTCYYTK
ncbi:MAG: hypothetical protein K2M34_02835 [Alphaproteobacteria bacterium]|nr:hypothetical protein [Alphaproteobacteria bacterium]